MKKIRIVCGTALLAASLSLAVGCASTSSNSEPTVQAPTPIIGAEGVPMPEWVNDIPQSEDMKYFVGRGRSGKTVTAKKNSAVQDAARQIGEWKASTITDAINDFVRESGETENTQSLEDLKVTSIARAKADTSGMVQRKTWVNQDGNFVILVEYPKANLSNSFKTSLNEFARNESAAFAEFKADEAYRLLETKIDKQ